MSAPPLLYARVVLQANRSAYRAFCHMHHLSLLHDSKSTYEEMENGVRNYRRKALGNVTSQNAESRDSFSAHLRVCEYL